MTSQDTLKNKNAQITFREQVVKDSMMTTPIQMLMHFYLAPENDKGD